MLLRLYPALGIPHFRLLWLANFPSTLGWQMTTVTMGYAAFTLSGSATAIGVVSSAMALPLLCLALIGGVAADRLPRRMLIVVTQGGIALGGGMLAALTLAGALQVWHLVAVGLLHGVAFSFNMPSRYAFVAQLVGPQFLRNAVALNNAGMNFSRIAGPAVAGALLAVPAIGIGGVFALTTAMYGLAMSAVLRLPDGKPRAEADQTSALSAAWEELLEGLRYIRSSNVLLTLMGIALVALFFGMPYQLLMPVFSEQVYDVGAVGLGVLMAASGVGALAGSLVVVALSHVKRPTIVQLALGVAFGLTLVGFALAPTFPLAVGLVALVGFTSAAYMALNNTLVMANTEPRFYGRVMSVYLMTFAVMPLGSLPTAWLADQIGGRATIALAGLVIAAGVSGVAALHPAYRKMR